jgi:hypothetical protein
MVGLGFCASMIALVNAAIPVASRPHFFNQIYPNFVL